LKQKFLRLKSPAKINLTLDILGKRADGFHDLDSLFLEIPLADDMEFRFSETDQDQLHVTGKFAAECPADNSNLIIKAVRLFREKIDSNLPKLSISIKKNIPAQAGLGGGSSNASYVLLACWRFSAQRISFDELLNLASQLGSDCPFFLKRGLARGTGRGEVLESKPIVRTPGILLITPDEIVSTKDAFSSLNPEDFGPKSDTNQIADWFAGKDRETDALNFQNTFQKGVSEQFSGVAEALKVLSLCCSDQVLLSGSGSSCFGLFFDESGPDSDQLIEEAHRQFSSNPRLIEYFPPI